jgi:hypothetical protein
VTLVKLHPARRRMAFDSSRLRIGQAMIEVGAPIAAASFVAALTFAASGFTTIAAPYAFITGFALVAFLIGVGLRGPAQDRLDAELERAIAAALVDGEDVAPLAEAA